MRITRDKARHLVQALEDAREDYQGREGNTSTLWESQRKGILDRLKDLPRLVEKAAARILVKRPSRGRPPKLQPGEKALLFLIARMEGKSNRDMEVLLSLLAPFLDKSVSYKYIERLYSDREVKLVLHNLFTLLVEEENCSGRLAGDGTGYSLSVEKHYRNDPEKSGRDYRYAFRFVDLETGMYVAYGYSCKSEMEAFNQALEVLEELDIPRREVCLDRYYSSRKVLRKLGKNVKAFLIPKKNLGKIGFQWYRVLRHIREDPQAYLQKYHRRSLVESMFSADKERFGRKIRQRREDRRRTATLALAVLHNLFTTRTTPKQ